MKVIKKEATVKAPLRAVWKAWTTDEGARTFFAPDSNVELKIGGLYEIFFLPDAAEGDKGSDGMRVLSFLPEKMLSFEWNNPPSLPEVRGEKTWVVVYLEPIGEDSTEVSITHLGWREGEQWQKAYEYFLRAWDVVLGRLKKRFDEGPIDWSESQAPSS